MQTIGTYIPYTLKKYSTHYNKGYKIKVLFFLTQ